MKHGGKKQNEVDSLYWEYLNHHTKRLSLVPLVPYADPIFSFDFERLKKVAYEPQSLQLILLSQNLFQISFITTLHINL